VESVDAYYNESQFKKGMDAAHEMSRHIPGWSFKVYTANEAQEFLRVSGNCVGAIVYPAGKIWAYKFVTQIVEILVNKGLNLQTETPVTRITPRKGKYAWHLDTPRGGIFASKVVLATNGYIQNLVPAFTKIRPTRDSMTIQRAPKSVSPSLNRSYIFYYKNDFDYLIEERQGDVNKLVFGGGLIKDPNPITYNDAEVADASRCHLQHQLPKVLKWEGEKFPQERVERCWSGIMGFSDDNLPWVGAVPESVGGGQDQWICAGYTGNGISQHKSIFT
jgi:glycine/D-amino acid oxidase-like deaminating enzyme